MPINKDLSVSPYFDDYDAERNYYKVLFKPGVAVQVRELNQLQTILQDQIEKFGNNIYKRGTIIDGVNFIYYPNYAYIKINDNQLDGLPAVPSNYVSHFIVDPSSNLTAHVINSADGFETTDPDLKTLYVRYINSGNDANTTAFNSSAVLKIYDYLDSVHSVNINNGSSGFSNTDSVVFCSALEITLSTNTDFTIGETITQTGNTHFALVTASTLVKGKNVLQIKPRTTDLSNTAISATVWQFTEGQDIIGSSSGATANIVKSVGFGATATVTTSADIGKISVISMVTGGEGYYVSPYATIKSSGAASTVGSRNYTDLNLTALNYIAQVTVSNKANTVGFGYAFGVTEGVIYQKGHFVRVHPQTIIVSKHSALPNALSVGFDTAEDIIDSNSDQRLLDISTGTTNQFAPGADRLKLTPNLVVVPTATALANQEFLSIVDFSEGRAFKENRRTQFNSISDEMALRTNEASGNFVINEFLVTTRSPANTANEGKYFSTVVDPGRGYIDGYRVETISNYYADVEKGIDFKSATNLSATIDYGNYILVNETAGTWNCNIGAQINLKSAATGFVSNTAAVSAGTLTSNGSTIGTARVRNFVYDSGEPGTPSAVYRLYIFSIKMNAGQNFTAIRGAQIGATTAIADAVLTFDASLNASVCKLFDATSGSSLLLPTGTTSTKTVTNLNYVYRTTSETLSMANTGSTSLLLSDPTEYFAYESTSLTDNEKRTLVLTPSANITFTPNTSLDGTASVTSGSNTVTITSASVNKYAVGNFIALYSAPSTYIIRRVTNKTATTLQLDSTATFTNGTASFSRALPKNVPVSLQNIAGLTATTSGGGKTLTINLGLTLDTASVTTCALTYDVRVQGATPEAKTADRNNFVKIDLTPDNLNGPWCIGIPDAFRLKNVYLGTSSAVDTTSTDVTDQFYLDHNQSADFYDLGYLYKRTDANITLGSSSWLLVQFDAFTSTPGVFTVNSYVSSNTAQRFADDSLDLASLGTKANSFEIPELYTSQGKYYDLMNCVDFRPIAAATASYAKSAAAATVNPSAVVSFSGTSKKFPLPESGIKFDRNYFLGRKDAVVITKDNLIKVIRGTPGSSAPEPIIPNGVLLLNKLSIPAYPCVASNFSLTILNILNKKMSSEKFLVKRIIDKTVKTQIDANERKIQQPKGYTMADIGKIERRVQDLEYNVALSLVESDLKDKVIPSISSPGLNRFKFGFFVDDYSTTKHSDLIHPEYNCEVVDSKVVPVSISTGIPHSGDNQTGACIGDFEIVSQKMASKVPVVVVAAPPPPVVAGSPAPPPAAPPPAPVITAKTVSLFRSETTTNRAKYSDTGWLTFSSVPAPYSVNYNFFGVADELKIEKRNAAGTVTVIRASADLINSGVLNFTHDPSTGREYKFTTLFKSNVWQYTLYYPIDDTVYVAPTAPSTNSGILFYSGALVSINPGYVIAQSMTQNFGTNSYNSLGITQTITIASLKPSTVHTVRVGDSSQNVTVSPVLTTGNGTNLSSTQVTTDASGVVTFEMFLDNTALSSLTSLSNAVANQLPGTLYISIESADKTSIGQFGVKVSTGSTGSVAVPTATGAIGSLVGIVGNPFRRLASY